MKTKNKILKHFLSAVFAFALLTATQTAFAENWIQVNTTGYGDVNYSSASMVEYGGDLYTGTYNEDDTGTEIWKYDGTSWTQVNTDGFGDADNLWTTALATYDGILYAAVDNASSGFVLYEYNGTSWSVTSPQPSLDTNTMAVTAMIEYDGELFLATANSTVGTEVWAYDGTSWTQSNSDGFDGSSNLSIDQFALHDGYLWAGTQNTSEGAELWRFDGSSWTRAGNNGLGDSSNYVLTGLASMAGNLYISANNDYGIQIIELGAGITIIESGGFGDSTNDGGSDITVLDNELYASVSKSTEGGEIWRWDGGTDWTKVSSSEFESGVASAWDLITFNNSIFVLADDPSTYYAEVWTMEILSYVCGNGIVEGTEECDDSNTNNGDGCSSTCTWEDIDTTWTQVNTDGFGDSNNSKMQKNSLLVFDDKLFAAVSNNSTGTEVWAYDGSTWTQANEDAFGDPDSYPNNNYESTGLVEYNDKLYASTCSNDGGGVFEYSGSGTSWTQVNVRGFGSSANLCVSTLEVYDNELYAGTKVPTGGTGAEVWVYNDTGTSWTQVNSDGFGDSNNYWIPDMTVFDGDLCAGTRSNFQADVYCYDGSSWSALDTDINKNVNAMITYNNKLYVSTAYSDETPGDILEWTGSGWTTVGAELGTMSEMFIYNHYLFAGNWYHGKVFWYRENWDQINETNFGTGNWSNISGMALYDGYVYAFAGHNGFGNGSGVFRWTGGPQPLGGGNGGDPYLIPEFSTWLLILSTMLGIGLLYKKREDIFQIANLR